MLPFAARRTITRQLRADAQSIADEITDEFLARHPDWIERYGALARTRGLEDARFHLEFLVGALLTGESSSFARYAAWTAGVLQSRGIGHHFLIENLEQLREASRRRLDTDGAAETTRVVDAGIAVLREGALPSKVADAGEAHPGERSLYLQAALAGERQAALNIALEALRAGESVVDIYQDMLQPAQYEVGRLWESNEITVAREHAATAVTQYVIARLYEHFPAPSKKLGNALITGVSGEMHQLGANMVADVLEADGWNVRFLGTQLPHRDILAAVDEHGARVVGVSAALLSHLDAVGELIEALRTRRGDDLRIIVGGAAFRAGEGAWRDLGADGFARDLRDARELVRRLTAA